MGETMSRTALVGLLALVVVAGCSGNSGPYRTPYPLPAGAVAVTLPTQAPFTDPIPSSGFGCEAMGPNRVVVIWDKTAHSISFKFDQWADLKALTILWPRGFSAREYQGHLELVTPTGSVIARDGQEVPRVIGLDPEHVCMVDGTQYQPVR
jgi:hypothetical protein